MNIGDLVYLKNFTKKIKFIINNIINDVAIIISINYRLILNVSLKDIEYISSPNFHEIISNNDCNTLTPHIVNSTILNSTKILHIDSEKLYLNTSLKQYKSMNVDVTGFIIKESEQPNLILCLLKKFNPNILVITGHDSLRKNESSSTDLNSYKNSKYFVESIKIARNFNKNFDNLVIIAGGCKSHHEALLKAGANFASSPNRILINVLDPVNIACLFAKTSNNIYLTINDLYDLLPLDLGSFDGVKTRGQKKN